MALPQLDNQTARRIFLDRHALAENPAGPSKGADLKLLIDRLGFVQLDSVNTVARAHDMILFSRRPTYRPKNLKLLYERDRALFEHWTHDAATIPIEFYPQWHMRFRRDAEKLKAQWRNWRRDGFEDRFKSVLDHIEKHGPVCSSDVGEDEKKGSGGWWDWHPSKTALEFLWRSGALAVVGRDGFRKRYDLTERVIDETLRDTAQCPPERDCIDWHCSAALDRLGFATSGELAAFWATVTPTEAKQWCQTAEAEGQIIPAEITCSDGNCRKVYARPALLSEAPPTPSTRVRVLSPFDPALRDRNRAQRLFGFHYRIEIFVPEAKRRYGYYVFPLLEGDRLVGRIDMKAQRDAGVLAIRAAWPEHGIRWTKSRLSKLFAELDRVARFAGLETVAFGDDWLRPAALH